MIKDKDKDQDGDTVDKSRKGGTEWHTTRQCEEMWVWLRLLVPDLFRDRQ
jgi:hypothetical protein